MAITGERIIVACDLTTIQSDACTSGIGQENNPIQLLQIIAQLQADLVLQGDAGADVSVDAILDRACTSGIGKVNNPVTLNQIIAQLICDTA